MRLIPYVRLLLLLLLCYYDAILQFYIFIKIASDFCDAFFYFNMIIFIRTQLVCAKNSIYYDDFSSSFTDSHFTFLLSLSLTLLSTHISISHRIVRQIFYLPKITFHFLLFFTPISLKINRGDILLPCFSFLFSAQSVVCLLFYVIYILVYVHHEKWIIVTTTTTAGKKSNECEWFHQVNWQSVWGKFLRDLCNSVEIIKFNCVIKNKEKY